MGLATTGISGLDAQFGGGVPRGTTILLISDPSNAVGLFSEQFAGGGLAEGEHLIFYQFDRPARGFSERLLTAARDAGATEPGKVEVFDGYAGLKGGGAHAKTQGSPSPESLQAQPIGREEAFSHILEHALGAGQGAPYRLCVESISSLITDSNEAEAAAFFRQLVHVGTENDGIQLVSVIKGIHSPQFMSKLKHYASGVLELGIEQKGFGIYSYLMISKMLNVKDPVRLLLFKETDKGLWLESTKRVF
ncbi:MAG: hypothetical protein HY556_06950 [Euryarchaeota archaeon]|nr:hypothetical protein [Euryarchaeota archaeon]